MNDPRSPEAQLVAVAATFIRLSHLARFERRQFRQEHGLNAIYALGGRSHRLPIERLVEAVAFWRNDLAEKIKQSA